MLQRIGPKKAALDLGHMQYDVRIRGRPPISEIMAPYSGEVAPRVNTAPPPYRSARASCQPFPPTINLSKVYEDAVTAQVIGLCRFSLSCHRRIQVDHGHHRGADIAYSL